MSRTLAATLLALNAGVTDAGAQRLSRIMADSGLTPEGFNILSETARPLYDAATPQPGRKVIRTNGESGSLGTVRLATMRDGCAHAKGADVPQTATGC